uniref:Uncharacterized protein n=1 Tax=viral metagenome TaxID=1070528 RepID=A0A6C0I681_9ZZZZ
MDRPHVATLLIGSALGSSILGVVFALVYLKKNKIPTSLKVNVQFASSPAKYFFTTFKFDDIEIIDMPVSMDSKRHPVTTDLNGVELFYYPDIPGFSLFNTDFELIIETFNKFWSNIYTSNTTIDNFTCLHIRRGDKLIYEKNLTVHSIENYITEIEKRNLSETKIVILTDEYSTFLDFKNERPGWNIETTSLPENNGFNIGNINKETPEAIKREVDRMIEDYIILSRSNYFIGTTSSSVSIIGRLLKPNATTLL